MTTTSLIGDNEDQLLIECEAKYGKTDGDMVLTTTQLIWHPRRGIETDAMLSGTGRGRGRGGGGGGEVVASKTVDSSSSASHVVTVDLVDVEKLQISTKSTVAPMMKLIFKEKNETTSTSASSSSFSPVFTFTGEGARETRELVKDLVAQVQSAETAKKMQQKKAEEEEEEACASKKIMKKKKKTKKREGEGTRRKKKKKKKKKLIFFFFSSFSDYNY